MQNQIGGDFITDRRKDMDVCDNLPGSLRWLLKEFSPYDIASEIVLEALDKGIRAEDIVNLFIIQINDLVKQQLKEYWAPNHPQLYENYKPIENIKKY